MVTAGGCVVPSATFRPVPLKQTFVGVSEHNMHKRLNMMNEIAFDYAVKALARGKQVMVFVHSRKDTGKTARAIQVRLPPHSRL